MAITPTLPKPSGEVILQKYCFDVREHWRSTLIDDGEVDQHIRCLYAGLDAGLVASSGGVVNGGYSVTCFRKVRGTQEVFVSRIYFRDKVSADKLVEELTRLIKPSAKTGWAVNYLKQPKSASDFDILDYEGKIKSGINQLRTRLGDENLDIPKVYAREGVGKIVGATDAVTEAAAESAKQAQQRAEDIAKAAQKGLTELEGKFDDFTKKQAEENQRIIDEIKKATNRSASENLAKITEYTKKMLTADQTIATEEKNLETLQKKLNNLKDPAKIKQTQESIDGVRSRLKSARQAKARYITLIDSITDIAKAGKGRTSAY